MNGLEILWFRRNLRLHDNPALHSATKSSTNFFPLYIFDTTHQGNYIKSYHQYGFILECLEDLRRSLNQTGSRLHIFKGCPIAILKYLHHNYGINSLSFEQDCEPIWQNRNQDIQNLSFELNFECHEHVSHTLWDPLKVIAANGGSAPLTYNLFVYVALSLGNPPFPVTNIDWESVSFFNLKLSALEADKFILFSGLPSLMELEVPILPEHYRKRCLIGGEMLALQHLATRLKAEEAAFKAGLFQPNQARPNLLGPPLSLSAAINLGAISIRYFYWKIHDLYDKINHGVRPPLVDITGQLMWREYFYTLACQNANFCQIENNPICLPIPWADDPRLLQKWKSGMTGYPFIDAGLRQLLQEGWVHHLVRNAIAMFLTRGDLWQSWEKGMKHMMENLIDCDFCINAGNWMWISSSAFDRLLNCSSCIDPVLFGKRLEPSGEYIRKYVPELSKFSFEFIHEPWKAPLAVQKAADCVLGIDYPERIVVHEEVSRINQRRMIAFGEHLREKFRGEIPPHCHPSAENEISQFFRISDACQHTKLDHLDVEMAELS